MYVFLPVFLSDPYFSNLPMMLLANHWPTVIFPILRSLMYVHQQGPLSGVELTTLKAFILQVHIFILHFCLNTSNS
jgi:hypothetical protein